MSSEKNKKLTPFEQAEQNVRIFSENVKMYDCLTILVHTLEEIKKTEGDEKAVLETLFNVTLESFSEFMQGESDEWN